MKSRLTGFLTLVCFLMSVAAAPTPAASPASSLTTNKDTLLLDQALNLSQTLGSKEQIPFLIELCTTSANVNASAEKTKQYSQKLWDIASTEPSGELHVVGQKNAVTCLSYVDPQAALDLLDKIDFKPPRPNHPLLEDHRYNAAEKIFVNLLARSESPETIGGIANGARYLGRTGQYPFVGIAKVIDALSPSAKTQINALLKDAIDFYTTETGFYNRDEEFFKLLQSLKNPAIDKELVAQAFSTFAQKLKQNPIDIPGDYYAEVHASNSKVFPFTHRPEAFLFQAYPQIRRLNVPLAAQLAQQDPRLKEAVDDMTYIPGRYIQGDPTSEEAGRLHLQWLQESLLSRIKNCQDSNPQVAATLAQRLTDLSSRIAGFAAVSSGLAPTNPTVARAIFQEQISQLDNLANSIGKLHATVALASAAYSLADLNDHKALSEQALDMGIGFFAGDVNADRAQNRSGFTDLKDLVIFTASQPSDILLTKVQQLPDDWLKAYLLLYEAEGHAKQNAPPAPSMPCPE